MQVRQRRHRRSRPDGTRRISLAPAAARIEAPPPPAEPPCDAPWWASVAAPAPDRPSSWAIGASAHVRNQRRIADLPSTVVRLGTFELALRRRVGDFIALVAEIESQIFSGVGFLIAVAEGAIERIVGVRFVAGFLVSIFGLAAARRRRAASVRFRWIDGARRSRRLGSPRGEVPAWWGRSAATRRQGSRLTTSLSTGDLSALGRGRAGRIVRGCCDSFSAGAWEPVCELSRAPGPR